MASRGPLVRLLAFCVLALGACRAAARRPDSARHGHGAPADHRPDGRRHGGTPVGPYCSGPGHTVQPSKVQAALP